MQSLTEANLSSVEKCIVANHLLDNWLHDSYRVKQVNAISEMYEYMFANEDRWAKFKKLVNIHNNCKINNTDNEDIMLDITFLWKGEKYILSYSPFNEANLGNDYDTFYIEDELGASEIENSEENNSAFDEIEEILDNVADKINAKHVDGLLIFKISHKNAKEACCKLLNELEKVLE